MDDDDNPINQIATMLWQEHLSVWAVRARNGNGFVQDKDLETAIFMAIEARNLLNGKP